MLILCFGIQSFALSDTFGTSDKHADAGDPTYLILDSSPIARLSICTSSDYLAGTIDNLFATFSGDFSFSGPHSIGSFIQGTTVEVSIPLDRVIGQLRQILISTDGLDAWLLSSLTCRLDGAEYIMVGLEQWLVASNFNLRVPEAIGTVIPEREISIPKGQSNV